MSQPSSAIAEKALPHPAQVQEPSSSGLSSDKGHEDDASDDGLVVMDSLGMLESVEGSVEVAVLILTDLLNYDKIRSGRMDFTQEYLDMGRIVEEVGYSFQVAAQAAGVRVVVTNKVSWDSPALGDGGDGEDDEMDEETLQPMRKAAPALKVLGDRMKLQQVCRNMISNAVKFTQDGGLVSITSTYRLMPLSHLSVLINHIIYYCCFSDFQSSSLLLFDSHVGPNTSLASDQKRYLGWICAVWDIYCDGSR